MLVIFKGLFVLAFLPPVTTCTEEPYQTLWKEDLFFYWIIDELESLWRLRFASEPSMEISTVEAEGVPQESRWMGNESEGNTCNKLRE